MHCPTCGVENPPGMNFCEECGTQLAHVCPSCGHEIRPTAKFCGNCLGQQQVREMVCHLAERMDNISPSDSDSVRPESFDKLRTGFVEGCVALSDDLIDTVVARTDGVPLFVEELTKSVVESVGVHGRAPLQSIPVTLHDSLMARLDRLGTAKEVAQLGATIGREFSYELLQAVSPLDEERLQHGLK